jgi:hypothetical protein
MRDYGVTYKSVPPPPMCDNSSAIKVRYHFLRDHVEKGDIVMKYSDTERQLVDIFMKPLDVTCFASLCVWGGGVLVFSIPMAWFEGELVFCIVYTLSCFHRIAFHHIYLLLYLLY